MRALVVAVIAAVALRHFGSGWIANLWIDPANPLAVNDAERELYYIFGGVQGAVLLFAFAFCASRVLRGWWLASVYAAMVYGIFQETLVAFCGGAYLALNGPGPSDIDKSAGMCNAAHGWEGWIVFAGVISLILLWGARNGRE
jgi:hypothetical protein